MEITGSEGSKGTEGPKGTYPGPQGTTVRCRVCGDVMHYRQVLPCSLGWFECKNGHQESYYDMMARLLIEVQPLDNTKEVRYTP